MSLGLLVLGLALASYAVLSRRLTASVLTAPIVFLGVGMVSELIGVTDMAQDEGVLRFAAEATLTIVLFSDAARIDAARLRAGWRIPARLLTIGLILTILLGTVVAIPLFPGLLLAEALILAVCLAPTDAALGMAGTDARIPARIRQALNVESGLGKRGICVPLLFIAIATAQAEGGAVVPRAEAILTVVEELGLGVVGGCLSGRWGRFPPFRHPQQHDGRGLEPRLDHCHGDWRVRSRGAPGRKRLHRGFRGRCRVRIPRPARERRTIRGPGGHHADIRFLEGVGVLLTAATFLFFGGIVVNSIAAVRPEYVLYAVLSLRSFGCCPWRCRCSAAVLVHRRWRSWWFGLAALASIVFAVIVLEDAATLPGVDAIVGTIVVAVVLSVLAHGLQRGRLPAGMRRGRPRVHVEADLHGGSARAPRSCAWGSPRFERTLIGQPDVVPQLAPAVSPRRWGGTRECRHLGPRLGPQARQLLAIAPIAAMSTAGTASDSHRIGLG